MTNETSDYVFLKIKVMRVDLLPNFTNKAILFTFKHPVA